jgi:1-aminocyclopropane-1-carboxylate deaminase
LRPNWEEPGFEPLRGVSFEAFVQRDDLIHPVVSGNKSRKLIGWLNRASEAGATRLVSMGGAYSNHLIALASAARDCGFESACYVRGDEPISNLYLDYAQSQEMELIPLTRTEFRSLREQGPTTLRAGDLFIPEGGAGEPAWVGFGALVQSWPEDLSFVIHASATASTALGLGLSLSALGRSTKVIAVAVLKNAEEQRAAAAKLGLHNVEVWDDCHWGGYAKTPEALLAYWKQAEARTGLTLDPIYTAKSLYALESAMAENRVQGSAMYYHSGGCWGGLSERFRTY